MIPYDLGKTGFEFETWKLKILPKSAPTTHRLTVQDCKKSIVKWYSWLTCFTTIAMEVYN